MARLPAPTPLTRLLGATVSWFLFALCFTLLFRGATAVMALGGSCASGGPYAIEVECPEAVVVFMPLSIFGGLIAVAIGVVFARGFGTPVEAWGWPILFGGLGGGFLWSFATTGDLVGLFIGILFVAMGLFPLVLALRASAQRVLLGLVAIDGTQFLEGERARPSLTSRTPANPENAIAPRAVDWLTSLGITALLGGLGVWVGNLWFASVGG